VDVRARVSVALADRMTRPLVTRNLTLGLPIDATRWAEAFSQQFRRVDDVHQLYERAESCVVSVAAPALGTVSLRCERAFVPLRWAFGRDRDGPYIYLVDNTDGVSVNVSRYAFSGPADEVHVSGEEGATLRWPEGGLFCATAGEIRSAVILPPLVRNLSDLRSAPPSFPSMSKSAASALKLIELANLWATAALPGDPFAAARRLTVLQEMAHTLAGLIGGQRWEIAERNCQGLTSSDLQSLRDAMGDGAYQTRLANALRVAVPRLRSSDVPSRVARFAAILGEHARPAGVSDADRALSEFLLRLATEPGTLLSLPATAMRDHLSLTLTSPVLLRAARFVVLATAADTDDAGSTYAGWTWQ
jgi:hypothetical protein